MKFQRFAAWGALIACVSLLLALPSCGGGDDTADELVPGGTLGIGDNSVDPLVIDGPTVSPGKQDPVIPVIPVGDQSDVTPGVAPPGVFGDNIYNTPADSNGVAHIVVKSFNAGQKVALVVANLNPEYRDNHLYPSGGFKPIPNSSYSVHANMVDKTLSGVDDNTTVIDLNNLSQERITRDWLFGSDAGAVDSAVVDGSMVLRSTSSIQKGEVRTFLNTQPREVFPPTIKPGPDEPEKDVSQMRYPNEYYTQDGRLVAIGTHCLVFLSTELNGGHPDTIQFTDARLTALASEFDNVIFPTSEAAFGPVRSYNETGVMRDLNRDLILDGDDFDTAGNLLVNVGGTLDEKIGDEEKIIIFLHNGEPGGFYVGAPLDEEEGTFGEAYAIGSTIYIASDNFPANSNGWTAAYSVMAHEFQHKLYSDNSLPTRPVHPQGGNYNWLNEGMSQMNIHQNGYTVNSGRIIDWAIDGQLTTYLNNTNLSAVCMDGNPYFPSAQQSQYGNGFLFMLYIHEHYDPGFGKRVYNAARAGESDYIRLIEHGAQYTTVMDGPDNTPNTADDVIRVTQDPFDNIYLKFAIANFLDGIYKDNTSDLFDSRFHYENIDLRGTINLASGTVVLPGVQTTTYPETGTYPVDDVGRVCIPYGVDYIIFSNGDGRDLDILLYADQFFKFYMLPVAYDAASNSVTVTPGVTINY